MEELLDMWKGYKNKRANEAPGMAMARNYYHLYTSEDRGAGGSNKDQPELEL